jgi:hypothetical protein
MVRKVKINIFPLDSPKNGPSVVIIPEKVSLKWFDLLPLSPDGGKQLHRWKGQLGNIDHIYEFVKDIYMEKHGLR